MVEKIDQLLLVTLPIKRAWSFFGYFAVDRQIGIYHILSNYPKTVELSSPKLNAYKS